MWTFYQEALGESGVFVLFCTVVYMDIFPSKAISEGAGQWSYFAQ